MTEESVVQSFTEIAGSAASVLAASVLAITFAASLLLQSVAVSGSHSAPFRPALECKNVSTEDRSIGFLGMWSCGQIAYVPLV